MDKFLGAMLAANQVIISTMVVVACLWSSSCSTSLPIVFSFLLEVITGSYYCIYSKGFSHFNQHDWVNPIFYEYY